MQLQKTEKIIFCLSLVNFLYWLMPQYFNVYKFAVIGAIFEFLWAAMIILLIALPVAALIYWTKNKFSLRSLYGYSLILSIATGIILFI